MGQFGRNLQAHKPVTTLQPVIDGMEEIGGALDIFYRERFVDFSDAFILQCHSANGVIVIMAARDGFLENGWIGGQPAYAILIDQSLDISVIQSIAPEKVKPDTLSKGLQTKQGILIHFIYSYI